MIAVKRTPQFRCRSKTMHSVPVSYHVSYIVQELFCNMQIFRVFDMTKETRG